MKGNTTSFKALKSLSTVFAMIKKMDALEKRVQKIRAYELNTGETTRVWEDIQAVFDKAYTKKEYWKSLYLF